MKFSKLLRNGIIVIVISTFFMVGYMESVLSDDRVVTNQYTVKINNVLFRRDIAEGILLRVKNEHRNQEIHAYDNIDKKDILLSIIEEGMDVNIRSELLSILSDMYQEYLGTLKKHDKAYNINEEVCITKETALHKVPTIITVCIDKQEKNVIHLVVL